MPGSTKSSILVVWDVAMAGGSSRFGGKESQKKRVRMSLLQLQAPIVHHGLSQDDGFVGGCPKRRISIRSRRRFYQSFPDIYVNTRMS